MASVSVSVSASARGPVICDLCVIFVLGTLYHVFGQHSSSMPRARILISQPEQTTRTPGTHATPTSLLSLPDPAHSKFRLFFFCFWIFSGEPGQTVFDEHFLIYDKGFLKIGKC